MRPVYGYETLVEAGNLRLIDGLFSFGRFWGMRSSAGRRAVPDTGLGIIGLRNAGHLGRIWLGESLAVRALYLFISSLLPDRIVVPLGEASPDFHAPVAIGVPHQTDHVAATFHFDGHQPVAEGKWSVKAGSALPWCG